MIWKKSANFDETRHIKYVESSVVESHPQVVAVEHGWWFPEVKDIEHGCFDSNVNVVITGDLCDPIYGCTNLKSIPCRVYKA